MFRSIARRWSKARSGVEPGGRRTVSGLERAPGTDAASFDARFAAGQDPWNYGSPYEVRKYEQTLQLALEHGPSSALELACAEGDFTARLAPHVSRLLATDFSRVALERARARLAAYPHVSFAQLDLLTGEINGSYDLITCCEVLYYLPRTSLRGLGTRLVRSLNDGGRLVVAHAHALRDSLDGRGFDWGQEFGVVTIARELAAVPELTLHTELQTEYYRIHVYQRAADTGAGVKPRHLVGEAAAPPPDVESAFKRP